MKNPVTPPGINPGTVRLVAQHLNHYATPGPHLTILYIKCCASLCVTYLRILSTLAQKLPENMSMEILVPSYLSDIAWKT